MGVDRHRDVDVGVTHDVADDVRRYSKIKGGPNRAAAPASTAPALPPRLDGAPSAGAAGRAKEGRQKL